MDVALQAEERMGSFNPAEWPGRTDAEKFENWLSDTLAWMEANNPDYQQNPIKYLAMIPDAPFDGTGI